MLSLIILNALFLFGLYTALKFKVKKDRESKESDRNLKAINLLTKYYEIRNGKLSLSEKLIKLNEFDQACDEFVESHFGNETEFTGENVAQMADYRHTRKEALNKAGH